MEIIFHYSTMEVIVNRFKPRILTYYIQLNIITEMIDQADIKIMNKRTGCTSPQ